jgi:predicted esterase YcpF (UPF0227 family)
MKAINPKNQSTVNKAINWLEKHNNFNDVRDTLEEYTKEYTKIDNKCLHSFDMFLEYMSQLPKNQQEIIYKSNSY